jgi:hypothetical protein
MEQIAEIQKALREILSSGLLRIRGSDSLDFCEREADHLHNIPFILTDPELELIKNYYLIERCSYLDRLRDEEIKVAEEWYGCQWRTIERYICSIDAGK